MTTPDDTPSKKSDDASKEEIRAKARARREEREQRSQRKQDTAEPASSPHWWAPTMVTLMVLGLASLVSTYLFTGDAPVPGLGNWNLAIGLGVALSGFLMTMKWR